MKHFRIKKDNNDKNRKIIEVKRTMKIVTSQSRKALKITSIKNKIVSKLNIRKKPNLSWSIGTKLTIIFLVMVIIPMSLTAFYFQINAQEIVEKDAEENLVDLSISISNNIEQLLIENQRTSATLAGDSMVIEFLNSSEEKRQNLTIQINKTLQNFADNYPDYDAPGLLDVNGTVVATLEKKLLGKNRAFRDYFKASIKGESYISDILVGRGTGRPGVFLTNPVINANGTIIGIDLIWLKADSIWDIIDEGNVGEEGISYLLDEYEVIIAHPNRSLLYHCIGNLSQEGKDIIKETIRFGTIEGTDTPLIPESLSLDDLADEITANQNSSTYRYYSSLDNQFHIVGYKRLEKQQWTVVVDVPEYQYQAPLQILGLMIWFSVGLTAAITLSISFLIVRSITNPIRKLSDAAVAVEKNQPFEPLTIKDVTSGRDEIAYLGRVFSSMVLSLRGVEAKLKRYSENLEDMVNQRTKELQEAQEQLIRSEKLALMGQLAGGMSHELRNPLGAIKNATYFLKMVLEEPETEVKETLEILEKEVASSEKIISSLLEYTRSRPLILQEENINEIIREELSRTIIPKNIEIVSRLDQTLPSILADPDQLYQIFRNIISNAIQAMPKGGQLVIKSEVPNPDWVVVSFKDTGLGIPEENQEKIFEPLFTTKAKGIGLGLSITKKLVESHGGNIKVESEVGKGTTFTVRLPFGGKKKI